MFGGWYVVGIRKNGAVVALIAGPFRDRDKAEATLKQSPQNMPGFFNYEPTDTFGIAHIELHEPVEGKCNERLWIKPEWETVTVAAE